MTAYTAIDTVIEGTAISFEIKSYNGRYFDLKVNVPFWLSTLEPFIREYFSSKILRGNIEISIRTAKTNAPTDFTVDSDAVERYHAAFKKIADILHTDYSPDVETIARQSGVLVPAESNNTEQWKTALMSVFDLAFAAFDKAKTDEGAACQANIEKQLALITAAVAKIEMESGNAERIFAETFRKKLTDLVGQNYDENRILQEVAAMLVKYTVNEELVRLKAHLHAMENEMSKDGAVAKRLDFICQEINREINTIGSKNQSYDIAAHIVTVKEALENIREQLKNLE